jgi:hypothetical protein
MSDCCFCSVISKANGEDPIGTAGTFDHWLILEMKQPWSAAMWVEDPRVQPLVAAIEKLMFRQGLRIRPLAIAPDPEYSQPGQARLLYYRRPSRLFAEFEKQEFIVPEFKLGQLANALLKDLLNEPNELSDFQQYRQPTSHIREMLVCTHANVDVACGRFGYPIYKQLRTDYAANSGGTLRVWRCSHFGGHQFAPTLIDLPDGRYWGHLEPEKLDMLVHRTGSVTDLSRFYRGWAGLSKWEQIAEREIWMQEGWDWLKSLKAGRVLEIKGKGIKKYLHKGFQLIPSKRVQLLLERLAQNTVGAKVSLEFATADGTVKGAYQAQVEVCGEVMSAVSSAKEIQFKPVTQYRVKDLVKIV